MRVSADMVEKMWPFLFFSTQHKGYTEENKKFRISDIESFWKKKDGNRNGTVHVSVTQIERDEDRAEGDGESLLLY